MSNPTFAYDKEPCLVLSVEQIDIITNDSYQRGYDNAIEELKVLWKKNPEKVKDKLE